MKNKIRFDYQTGDKRPTEKQRKEARENGWGAFEHKHGYGVFQDSEDDFSYIARIDEMGVFSGDSAAAKQAQKDGYKLLSLTCKQKQMIRKYDDYIDADTILLTRHNVAVLRRVEKETKE